MPAAASCSSARCTVRGLVPSAIANAELDLRAQADPDADTTALLARYPKAKTGDFDGDPKRLTEMDALVAYLQMLGTLVSFGDLPPERLRQ